MDEEKAKCLVDYQGDTLKLMKDGLVYIESIPEGYGIITKAIVGPGRIGKSSLLNWLVRKNVFEIGSKTTRVTKGIWIYIDVHHESKLVDMYIDVEGFGDPSKANVSETDNQLLIIVLQICDVIMYNIKGVYDMEMCDKIKFVCNLFNRYRKQNHVLSKPILLSVLRDFDLDLPESPDQDFRDLFQNSNAVFETFRDIKAFPLVKPVEGKITDLKNTPDANLCPEFVDVRNRIEQYLRTKAEPLCTTSKKNISGIVLAENLRKTVKAVNDEDLKFVSKTLTEIFKEQNEAKVKSALEAYEKEMKKDWPNKSDPETLSHFHGGRKTVAVNELEKQSFIVEGSVEVDRVSFEAKIEAIFKSLSFGKCKAVREEVCMTIENRIKEESYHKIGGFERYSEDFSNAEKQYESFYNLGPEKETVWSEYKASMKEAEKVLKSHAQVHKREMEAEYSKQEAEKERRNLQFEQGCLEAKSKEIKNKEASAMKTYTEAVRGVVGVAEGIASAYCSIQQGNSYSSPMPGINPFTINGSSSTSTSEGSAVSGTNPPGTHGSSSTSAGSPMSDTNPFRTHGSSSTSRSKETTL